MESLSAKSLPWRPCTYVTQNSKLLITPGIQIKLNFILNSTLLYIAAQLSSPTKRKMCLQLSLSFACHLVKFTAHSYAGGGKSGGGSAAWPSGLAARRLGCDGGASAAVAAAREWGGSA